MADDNFKSSHYVDRVTGQVHRSYTYKRRPAIRLVLTSKLAEQYTGYMLIEKDLRSSLVWLDEIENRHLSDEKIKQYNHFNPDRENFNLVKGLFVALLTFYGKCFTQCEGRRVKLERVQIDPKYHVLHDECMKYRHNFAAHSGAKKLEKAEIALVYPAKIRNKVEFKIFKELDQPDFFMAKSGEVSLRELLGHVREKVLAKMDKLHEKIVNEEILPNAEKYFSRK
ncbi:hypothetical protein HMPREF9701_00350 [Delftia acidovorans CCUG 274B]|nr:hypothetical protein HMPREF9701_00350 [Delftia acidovorans CCUG 274B]